METTKLAAVIRSIVQDNGRKSDGQCIDEIIQYLQEQGLWDQQQEPVQEKVDMQIDGVCYIVTPAVADTIHNILQQEGTRNDSEKKKWLMSTMDGVQVYQGDSIWLERLNVNDWTTETIEPCPECISYDVDNYQYWKNADVLNIYIADNKPMFSYRELQILIDGRLEAPRTIQKWNSEQLVWQIRQIAMNKLANKQ